jgi:hypothetical protein
LALAPRPRKKALFGTIDSGKIAGSGGGAVRFGCGRSAALADAVASVRIAVTARHGVLNVSALPASLSSTLTETSDRRVSPRQQPSFVSLRHTAQNSENEALRFAKRNESFRDDGLKSLRSLRVLNQLFRGIVCFQWVEPNFVSHRFRVRSFIQSVAGEMLLRSGDHSVIF